MDIRREICVLKNSSCTVFSIQNYCTTFVNSVVDKYSPRIKRPKKLHHRVATGIIWKNNIYFTDRRRVGVEEIFQFPFHRTNHKLFDVPIKGAAIC